MQPNFTEGDDFAGADDIRGGMTERGQTERELLQDPQTEEKLIKIKELPDDDQNAETGYKG